MRRSPDRPLLLTVDGRIVAALEQPATRRARARGLLGRHGLHGALLLGPTSSVHTFGMRFAIDVALCTSSLQVVSVHHLRPGRMTLPRPLVRMILEAEAGSFARWGVRPGAHLGTRDADGPEPGQFGSGTAST